MHLLVVLPASTLPGSWSRALDAYIGFPITLSRVRGCIGEAR